jgi:hypothetical protein
MMNIEYKGAVCRGCWELGNNCGKCEKCIATKPDMSLAYEGAREDLTIWKKRAIEAEAKLKETTEELKKWRDDANWSRKKALIAESKLGVIQKDISDDNINLMFQRMTQNPITTKYTVHNWFMSGVIVGQQFVKTMVEEHTSQY